MHLSMSSPRGEGSGNPREFDCDVHPQGEDFDHFIFQLKGFVQKGRILNFWPIFIFCRIELIFGRLTCFDMKSIVP